MRDTKVRHEIVTLDEFKANFSKIVQEIGASDEPLVVTEGGRPVAILISPNAFQQLSELKDILESVAAGLADSDAGQVVNDGKVRRWLATWGTDPEGHEPE